MMKTILVIYSNERVSSTKDYKKYAFNTDSDVEVGDMLETNAYNTNLIVVRVLEEAFKYYDASGKLSNNFNSTRMDEIKTLKVVEGVDNTIIATKVDND